MPPRKRARASRAASPTTASQPKTPTPAEESSPVKDDEDVVHDPWTDEEEIGLFKGLIRCKPTGIHKHFHLIALHHFLLDNGYIHPKSPHTTPAGIWRKLQTLYNLEALDEREDARQLEKMELDTDEDAEDSDEEEDDADAYSDAAHKIENEDFHLPGADFDELKWKNRLASDKQRRDESPPLLPELNLASAPPVRFTPTFSIEPEVVTPRARGKAATTPSTKAKPASSQGRRRSTRQVEVDAQDVEAEEEEEDEAEEEEEGEEEQEDDEEDAGEGQEESARSTPASRLTRRRGRPPATTGRGRGRGK